MPDIEHSQQYEAEVQTELTGASCLCLKPVCHNFRINLGFHGVLTNKVIP